ncbi:mCG145130, partial [Mus musculus]
RKREVMGTEVAVAWAFSYAGTNLHACSCVFSGPSLDYVLKMCFNGYRTERDEEAMETHRDRQRAQRSTWQDGSAGKGTCCQI